MKELARETQRLSKAIDALGAQLSVRAGSVRRRVRRVDPDLFKAMPAVETATYPESVSTQAATSPSARQEAGRSTSSEADADDTATTATAPRVAAVESVPSTPSQVSTGSLAYTASRLGKRRLTPVSKYREDQSRDEDGRWVDEGRGSGSGAISGLNRSVGGLAGISTEAQAKAYTARMNNQLSEMRKLPTSAWKDPTVLDRAWGTYLTTMGAVAITGAILVGGVRIIGTPNAVAIFYGLLGVRMSAKRLGSTLAMARNLLYRTARNKQAASYGLASLVGAGLAAVITPKQSGARLLNAASVNAAVLGGLANTPKTAAVVRAIVRQTSIPNLVLAGKVTAGIGALLATAMTLRYAYRQFQTKGQYQGVDETKRRLETIEHHLATLRRYDRTTP